MVSPAGAHLKEARDFEQGPRRAPDYELGWACGVGSALNSGVGAALISGPAAVARTIMYFKPL
jgi:hypothetical protein